MAYSTLNLKPVILATVGGVDESTSQTAVEPSVVATSGVCSFFDDMHQRMFGKKIVDFNPATKVWAIHQSFNGVCLYGYFVETDVKLYFHMCQAPPDLRIKFVAPLQS